MEEIEYKIGTNNNPVIISLKEFKGRRLLDIRKYYRDKSKEDETLLPTKKGISLNQYQLNEFLEKLNENKIQISEFFDNTQLIESEIDVEILDSNFGRSFNLKYENNETTIKLTSDFVGKIGEKQIDFFKKVLDCVYRSAIDIIEDNDDCNIFMDILNKELNKTKW